MDPVIALADTRLAVEPGEQVRTTATVRNAGTIVEQYELHVLGLAADWSDVLPREVSVLPGGETTVEVVFRPPRDAMTPAGDVPFGFRCVSLEHPDRMAVAEGDVAVGAVLDSNAELAPLQSHGRWSGRHRLVLHNRGTVTEHFQLAATDPADALAFALMPDRVDVPPGGRGEASIRVRTNRPFLRGQPKPHPFQISYQPLGGRAGEVGSGMVPGTFEQRPVLSKLVVILLALAVAGIAALIALNARRGDAAGGGIPPTAPTVQEAQAVGSDKVRLIWARDPNATGYRVDKLLPAKQGEGVEDSKEVPGERSAFTWEGLAPETEHCFRLVAKNDAGDSQPSEPSCVDTPSADGALGAPPEGLEVTAQDKQARLEWDAVDKKASYIVFMDNTEAAKVPAGKASAVVPVETPGKHCFSVVAQLEDAVSDPSKDECAQFGDEAGGGTGPGTGPGGQGPGGQGPGGQGPGGQNGGPPSTAAPGSGDPVDGFFVIFDNFPLDDPAGQSTALGRQEELQQMDQPIPAEMRPVSESETLKTRVPNGGWVVYHDDFSSREAAIEFCQERGEELEALGHECVAP